MTKKVYCAIPQCRNASKKTAGEDVIHQDFPLKEKIRRRWIRSIQSTFKSFTVDETTTPLRLCSDHFEEGCFISSKNGKRIFKLDAVPTIFENNALIAKKEHREEVRPRHQSRRAASKEALKQMQILLEDEDEDAPVEIPDDDDVIPVAVPPPKKKYKLTHRKSSDGNDREVLVLKSITPSITNHYVENNLELECWVEELEPCQKERNKKLEEEEESLQAKLDELIKACKGEVVYKGNLTTVIEVSEHVQKTIQAVQASHNKPPIVLNSTVATPPPPGFQLVMDPRRGLLVGAVPPATSTPPKQGKIQVATNLQAPPTPTNQSTPVRGRPSRGKKQTPVVQPPPPTPPTPPAPITTRSVLNSKQGNKRSAPPTSPVGPPATRSRVSEPAHQTLVTPSPPVTRSREPVHQQLVTPSPPVTRSREPASQQLGTPSQPATRSREPAHQPMVVSAPVTRSRVDQAAPVATPPVTRSRPGTTVPHVRPTESSVEGGLATGSSVKPKAIVDLTSDDGRPLPDSREVSFNKLQGKTFPSLVVVARPHLRVADVNSDRAKLDAKVKAVLMYAPTKFTEWLIQQGLVKSEQKCSIHTATQLKLGMYSDVSKFPYSGGYVWISECCPQRFVSVFSGSIFEGSPHPPLVILKTLYHWACQTNIQNVIQWVKVDNLYVKGMYTWLRAVCTVALQTHLRQLGGPQTKVEVGVISLGTTSQDGNSRQVKVEVLGILETATKLIRLRAIEPLADGDRNYKKRFSKILEPLVQWVHPSSIIVTDLTVDKATLHQMGFSTVIQTTSVDASNSNRTIMEYLRRIVPRMFQNTLSLLSRQIIQQFLDELVWREWFGTTSMTAFDHLVAHLAEQTRYEANQSLVVRLNRVSLNPFKTWTVPATSKTEVPAAPPSASAAPKTADTAGKKRKRKEPEPPPKPAPPPPPEAVTRPPKSTSPDVPEQMVPLENYYYGTIDNYPPKTNVTLTLKCPFCKDVFNNNIVLMNHLFKHAHNVSKDGQMCRYCLTSVPTANDLLKHIASAHPSETKHDNGFVCLICETQYMNPFVLGKHMSKEHCPSELPYQCGTCGYRCSNHKQAIDHFYKQHDNGPTIQCPFCLKSTTVFSSSRNIAQNMHYFIQHLQKHQRKQYAKRCGKCNLWFVQKDVLKEHQTKMHASQRGKTGLVAWIAPRNGVMVPKSKMDKYPCDAEGINFTTLFYNVPNGLKCKECDGAMDSTKHFSSFESCQNPNCLYSTCCSNAMQEHNAKCNKNSPHPVPAEKLPYEMFCICGYSSTDGNEMAKHLTICEKKSAYPSLSDAKSASVTHSMLDVLGLVRKPEDSEKKTTTPSRTVKRNLSKSDSETIMLDDDEQVEDAKVKTEKTKTGEKQATEKAKATRASKSTSRAAKTDSSGRSRPSLWKESKEVVEIVAADISSRAKDTKSKSGTKTKAKPVEKIEPDTSASSHSTKADEEVQNSENSTHEASSAVEIHDETGKIEVSEHTSDKSPSGDKEVNVANNSGDEDLDDVTIKDEEPKEAQQLPNENLNEEAEDSNNKETESLTEEVTDNAIMEVAEEEPILDKVSNKEADSNIANEDLGIDTEMPESESEMLQNAEKVSDNIKSTEVEDSSIEITDADVSMSEVPSPERAETANMETEESEEIGQSESKIEAEKETETRTEENDESVEVEPENTPEPQTSETASAEPSESFNHSEKKSDEVETLEEDSGEVLEETSSPAASQESQDEADIENECDKISDVEKKSGGTETLEEDSDEVLGESHDDTGVDNEGDTDLGKKSGEAEEVKEDNDEVLEESQDETGLENGNDKKSDVEKKSGETETLEEDNEEVLEESRDEAGFKNESVEICDVEKSSGEPERLEEDSVEVLEESHHVAGIDNEGDRIPEVETKSDEPGTFMEGTDEGLEERPSPAASLESQNEADLENEVDEAVGENSSGNQEAENISDEKEQEAELHSNTFENTNASSSLESNAGAGVENEESEIAPEDKKQQSDTFENISDKNEDSQVQLFDETSIQPADETSLSHDLFPGSSNDGIKESEASDALASALGESEESVNRLGVPEPMDYEDISNSGLEGLTVMETD